MLCLEMLKAKVVVVEVQLWTLGACRTPFNGSIEPLSDPHFAPPLTFPFKKSSVLAMYTGLTKITKGN